MTHSITKTLVTETAHRLTDYSGKCAHLHGHSYHWVVTVEGNLDHRGIVADFGDVKKCMENGFGFLDHALVLHDKDPLLAVSPNGDEDQDLYVSSIFADAQGNPANIIVVDFNPTAENLARWAAHNVTKRLPENMTVSKVEVWETANSCGVWTLNEIDTETEDA